MLTETAHVVAVESGSVWVETIRQSSCGSCAAKQGCGHSLLQQISAGSQNYLRVFSGKLSAAQCSVDDHVRISIPERVILRGSLLVYIVPLVAMLTGATLGSILAVGNSDSLSITGAVAGFALGVTLVRLHAWFHRSDESLHPRLVERVSSPIDIVSVG